MGLFSRTAAAGLYDLRPGAPVFRELSAYEAALALLSPALERCEAPFFSPRADRAQLERLCALCGFHVPAGMELPSLREAAAALADKLGCREASFRTAGGTQPFGMAKSLDGTPLPQRAYLGPAFE